MNFFLELIAPLENYDFSNFLHNIVLALPASVLAGLGRKRLAPSQRPLHVSPA